MTSKSADETLLAVIVAAYNVDKFIEHCLLSVLSQADCESHVHLIVVLDGPTDRTEQVVRHFVGHYQGYRISIIKRGNGGLSAARNAGLQEVRSEYVTFLDGDDFWLPDYLQLMLPILRESRPDIIEYDALLTDETAKPFSTLRISAGPENQTTRITKLDYLARFRNYSWARIFRTELVNERHFPPGLRYEDTHTTPWYYDNAEHILSLGRPLLGYRQRMHSIVASPSLDDVGSLNTAAREAIAQFLDIGGAYWSGIAMRCYQQACGRLIALPFSLWKLAMVQARQGMRDEFDPGRHPIRVIQVKWPWAYVILLYIKRNTVDWRKLRKQRSAWRGTLP